MDQFNYFLSHGLWSVVEALFNSHTQFIKEDDKYSVEKWLLEIATHPNQSRFKSSTLRHPWQQSWLAASHIHRLITSSSQEIRIGKWFTDQKLSRTDIEKLKKVSEMHGMIYSLPEPISVEIKNELIQLYISIISVDYGRSHSSGPSISTTKGISADAVTYLKTCLLRDPSSTNPVIQRLLCLWSSHFVQSDSVLQDIYEAVFHILLQSLREGNYENTSKLFCLLTTFEVSEEKEKKIIEHVFPHILNLCNEKKVSLAHVYLSLMGRGKFSLLRALIGIEEEGKMWKSSLDEKDATFYAKVLQTLVENDGKINLREIFMRAYKRNVPWIEDVVGICVQAVLHHNIEDVKACLSNSGLKELWPLVYFELWQNFLEYGKANIDLKAIIEECKNVVEDKKFLLQISQMERCLRFAEWIVESGTAKTDSFASVVEQVTNSCCTVHALKRTTKLFDLDEESLVGALNRFRMGDGNNSSSKTLVQAEICIFKGYFLVMTVYKAILSAMDIESTSEAGNIDNQDTTDTRYEENVKKKFNDVKYSISQLYPLTFRVEILEYLFSLLFLQHKDLHDENTSDSGGEDDSDGAAEENQGHSLEKFEGTDTAFKLATSNSVSSDLQSFQDSIPSRENQLAKGIAPSRGSSKRRSTSGDVRNSLETSTIEESKRSSGHGSRSGGSELSGSAPPSYRGPGLYVCGPRVVKDLLHCLKECLVDASVALFSSLARVDEEGDGRKDESLHEVPSTVTEDSVQKRMARLSHYVGEAACRLEIVSSERSAVRKMSSSHIHPFWHDLPGMVGKPIWTCVGSDMSDDSEDEGRAVETMKTGSSRKRKTSLSLPSTQAGTPEMKPGLKKKSRSETEKSSESGSQSNATGGASSEGGGRRRGRRSSCSRKHSSKSARISERIYCGFCQPSRAPAFLPSFGIIDRMLASPKSLVIQCLSRGEIIKAKKVVEIFKLEETPLAFEARFLEEYVSLLHKLDKKTKEQKLNSESFSTPLWSSTLQSVRRAATAGMQSTSFSSIIESFIATVKPPIIEGLDAIVTDYPQAAAYLSEILPEESYAGHNSGYVGPILTDLALTYPGTSEQSSSLLDVALKHCPKKPLVTNTDGGTQAKQGRVSPFGKSSKFQPSYSPNSSQSSGPMGFATFLHNAAGALKVLNDRCRNDDGPWSFIETPLFVRGKKLSMPDLIATSLPLNPVAMTTCLLFWEELFKSVKDLKEVMFGEGGSEVDSVSSSRTGDEGQRKKVTLKDLHSSNVNGAFNTIINVCCSIPWHAEGVSRPDRSKRSLGNGEAQYLQMLFAYLKLISSLMIQSNLQGKGFLVPSCYFDVLNEGISSIVGKLVFECDVTPSRLESMASKINLDLVSCIMGNCCPPIKSFMPQLECADWHSPSRPPALLVEKLLSNLLDLLREKVTQSQGSLLRADVESASRCQSIRDLLSEGTRELANVSMDLLLPGDESVSFFSNLSNLATLHAILFLEVSGEDLSNNETKFVPFGLYSSNPSERLLARMSVCYMVGSLGMVSIHDLCQISLGKELALAICDPLSWKYSSLGNSKPKHYWNFPPHSSLIPPNLTIPPPDARLLFVISTGQGWCTRVTVLSSSLEVNAQLDSIIKEYLSSNIRFSAVSPSNALRLPCLLRLYCQCINVNRVPESHSTSLEDSSSMNSTIASSPDGDTSVGERSSSQGGSLSEERVLGLLDFLGTFASGQLKEDVADVTARFSPGSLQDLVVKVSTPDCSLHITLDNKKTSDGESIEVYDEESETQFYSKKEGSEWVWQGGALPTAVLEYLELRCWPLSTIAVMVNNIESSVFLPPIMPHATSLKHLLREILDYPVTEDKTDGIVAALSPEGLPSDRLWSNLDHILLFIDQMPSLKLLGFLKMIPQPRFLEEPKLTVLHDLVMWEISSREPDQDNVEPWRYCMQIQDPSLRVACVLSNINKWASIKEGVCREALLALYGNKDVDLCISSHSKATVLDTLHKVEIYEKIFAHVKSATVNNWYDVCYLLENDPGVILQKLIQVKQVTLFLKWMELHNLPENILNLIGPNIFVLLLDSNPPDFTSARKLMELLPLEHASKVCQGSLPYLNSLSCLKFAISFLLEHCQSVLSSEEYSDYEQWAIGLLMISHRMLLGNNKIKLQKRNSYSRVWSWLDLASNPLLILEQLLMNVQLEALEGVLALLKPRLQQNNEAINRDVRKLTVGEVDTLLRQYAARALEFRVCTGQAPREGVYNPPHLSGPPPSFITSNSVSSLSLTGTAKGEKLLESLSSGSVQSLDLEFTMPAKAPSKAEWVPNDEVTVCMCCKMMSFSMFNRRHHCRRCGRVICGSCSTRRLKVEGYQGVPVRVCDDCHSSTHRLSRQVSGYGDVSVRVCDNCQSQSTVGSTGNTDDMEHEEAEEVDEEDPEERLGNNSWWWRLTGDKAQDSTVREEFSFEQSPSVSLCLAILQHHSPGDPAHPRLLLDSAENLLSLLRPSLDAQKSLNPEVDHALVVQMVRSLAVASKVLYSRIGVGAGVERCDKVIGRAGLLNLLVRSGWAEAGVWAGALLEPYNGAPTAIIDDSSGNSGRSGSISKRRHHGLMSLRDRLVQEEQWELALEVVTKGGLGRAGIWAAWGKACLRVGGWDRARSLFARCLQKGGVSIEGPPAGALTTSHSSHLSEVIKILEETNVAFPVLLEEPPSYSSHPYSSVLHSLSSLDAISKGIIILPPAPAQERPVGSGPPLKEDVREECLFYLRTYGTEQMVVDFHLRHGEIKAALLHFLNARMNPETFLDEIYLRCLRMGWVTELEAEMKAVDPSLERWKTHLCCLCRLLEHRGMLHILYTAQVFAEDHVRAAMTCIRFYCTDTNTFSQMRQNCVHLHNAQKHMEAELANVRWGGEVPASQPLSSTRSKISPRRKTSEGSLRRSNSESSILPLKMDPRDLDRHINTIRRQEEVAKFLANCEAAGKGVCKLATKLTDKSFSLKMLPTLFGSTLERVHLAVLTIICGKDVEEGFGIAFRIIQDYHLKAGGVFELAGKMLVAEGRPRELVHLISCIQSSGISECNSICDQVANCCIQSLFKLWEKGLEMAKSADEEDSSSLENALGKNSLAPLVDPLLKVINDPVIKLSAYITCGQLKNAYLIAVRINSNSHIERISEEAERLGQSAIYRICQRRLEMVKNQPSGVRL